MLVLLMGEKYAAEMVSCFMIHIPSFMTGGAGVQAIFWFSFNNLRGCSVGIIDGRFL
jgi:hypothetical protein